MAQIFTQTSTATENQTVRISPMTRPRDGSVVLEFVGDSGSTLLVVNELETLKLLALLSNAAHALLYNRVNG